MLRDYVINPDSHLLEPIFDRFGIKYPADDRLSALLEFRVLTPDSFIWKFLINKKIYYLYAEDYIESKETLMQSLNALTRSGTNLELMKVNGAEKLHYKRLEDSDDMKQYAVESGYDFVFLAGSDEDPNNAYFNE